MRVIFTYNERSEVFLIFSELWQQEIDQKQVAMDKMVKDFEAEQIMLPDNLRKKREDEIFNKEKELTEKTSCLDKLRLKSNKSSEEIFMLKEVIADIDLVCMMSVNPGFGGQMFIDNTYSKIIELKSLIAEKSSQALIEIDGGVSLSNYKKLVECGADVLVAGNTVFSSSYPIQTILELKNV
jgi:hypothetical protein